MNGKSFPSWNYISICDEIKFLFDVTVRMSLSISEFKENSPKNSNFIYFL